MSKITYSTTAIIALADFVLKNYGHISLTIEKGIELTRQTYPNSKLTLIEVYDLLQHTAHAMQSVENQGTLKGLAKKLAVLDYIEKEYLETKAEINAIWAGWKTTLSWFIDQLIAMLNSGRSVLEAFAG